MYMFFIIVFVILIVIDPPLGIAGLSLYLVLHILTVALSGDKNNSEENNGKKEPEYDEFDFWQDNQGF